MAESLKKKTAKGVIWSSVERFSVQGVQFVVMLVIARILDPKDFGLVGMLTIFLAIAQSLIDSGFSQALIRKQDRTEVDNSTVFYFNIVVSVLLYLILFTIAPWVAAFYNEPQLTGLMRVLCLVIVINSFAVVQRVIYSASINFRIQAKASFFAAFVSGLFGVLLAKMGFGVWTLVWQQLMNATICTLLLWAYSTWHPQFLYSWKSFKELFAFGSKLMVSGLIDTIYGNLYALIIGKVFNAASLGYYAQADRFTRLPSANIGVIIQRVTYPVLCTMQDDDEKLRENYRRLLRVAAFIIFPLMCVLAGLAYPLVEVILGSKWEFTATLIIPICFNMMFYPIAAINLNLLQVKGRSDLFLRLEIIKKIIGVTFLIFSVPFGLVFMCYAAIVSGLIMLYANTYYTYKLIGVGFLMQFKDSGLILASSIMIFGILIGIGSFVNSAWLHLVFGICAAVLIYVGAAWSFHFKELEYVKKYIGT